MDKETVQLMKSFVLKMHEVYHMAEALRDCTSDGKEKDIFNRTRGALYNLKEDAKELADNWEYKFNQQ